MAADMGTAQRNKAIVFALCKRLSLDPRSEEMKWVEFASNFPNELEAFHAKLKGLNEDLARRSVLLDHGLQPSEAGIVVFSALHSFVSRLSEAEMQKNTNGIRWMDYIQNKEAFGETMAAIAASNIVLKIGLIGRLIGRLILLGGSPLNITLIALIMRSGD